MINHVRKKRLFFLVFIARVNKRNICGILTSRHKNYIEREPSTKTMITGRTSEKDKENRKSPK